MRRKLAYIFLSGALLLGSAAVATSAIVKMETDVSYGEGKELYFKISDKDSTLKGIGAEEDNYYVIPDNYAAVDAVAAEFESRIENWSLNATVTKQGYDTIKVTVRDKDTDLYGYLERYLGYSGGDITISAGSTADLSTEDLPEFDSYMDNNMFKGQTAEITYVNNIPLVTIDVNEPGKEGEFAKLVDYCSSNTREADSSAGTAAQTCYIVLWANKQEGDEFKYVYDPSSEEYDPNMAKRVIFAESAANAWYDATKDDDDFKKFQLVPNSSAIKDGSFDPTKAGAAYNAARYYMSMLNASAYEYDVNFVYDVDIQAAVDPLVDPASYWHLTPAFGPTMIACVVALAIGVAILIAFYRLGALSILSNIAVTIIGSILIFGYFAAQFGIGAVVGLALVALIVAFGGIYYFAKIREELYRGRTAKKAHTEATRKALWPTLDAGIVGTLLGIFLYAFVPSVIGKLGLMLTIGSIIGTVVNIVLFKLQGWLLANDNGTQSHLRGAFGVDPEKVPGTFEENKEIYESPIAKRDFTKAKLPVAIAAGAILLASVVGTSVFTAVKGSAYNYAGAFDATSEIYLEYRVEQASNPDLKLATKEAVEDDFLPTISLDDKPLDSSFYSEIKTSQGVLAISGVDSKVYDVYYYNIVLNQYFDENGEYSFTVGEAAYSTLQDALDAAAINFLENDSVQSLHVTSQKVIGQAATPSVGTLYLGLGLGVAAAAIYSILRFRLSRGLAASVISFTSGFSVIGFFALTRIPVDPVVGIGACVATFIAFLLSFIVLNKTKEIEKDSRERDKKALEFRNESLKLGGQKSAEDVLLYFFLAIFVALSFLALAPATYRFVFVGMIFGLVLAATLTMCVLTPFGSLLAKWFSKIGRAIRIDRKRGEKKAEANANNGPRKRGAEPEEAVFIGIND